MQVTDWDCFRECFLSISNRISVLFKIFIKFMEDRKPIQTRILFTLIGAVIAGTVASIVYSW